MFQTILNRVKQAVKKVLAAVKNAMSFFRDRLIKVSAAAKKSSRTAALWCRCSAIRCANGALAFGQWAGRTAERLNDAVADAIADIALGAISGIRWLAGAPPIYGRRKEFRTFARVVAIGIVPIATLTVISSLLSADMAAAVYEIAAFLAASVAGCNAAVKKVQREEIRQVLADEEFTKTLSREALAWLHAQTA